MLHRLLQTSLLRPFCFCIISFFFFSPVRANDDTVFGDAQWIGGNDEDMCLYSPYLTVFKLGWDVESNYGTGKDSDCWVKFGGADERFTIPWKNAWQIENISDSIYVLVLADTDKGEVRVSRNGMDPSGYESLAMSAQMLKSPGKHHIEMQVAYGTTNVIVDGENIGMVNLNPARGDMDKSLSLNGDFVAYPCLGKVTHGTRVKDLELRNYRSPHKLIAKSESANSQDGSQGSVFSDRSCLQLRTQFDKQKAIENATLYITARGIYDAYLNSELINPEYYFCPGFTQYDRTHLYQTFDLTDLICEGSNLLEIILAEGWWSGASTYSAQNWNFFGDRQSLLARLSILYTDGSIEDIVTNPVSWECNSDGAQFCASMFNGAVIDGSRRLFSPESKWHKPTLIPIVGTTVEGENYNHIEFLKQEDAPVHPIDTLNAISVSKVRPGVYIYDMGQNCAAVPYILLENQEKGSILNLRYAEMLYNGDIMTENYRAAISQDKYICGGGTEVFSPRQTLHGYRYIEISGLEQPLPLGSVKSIALSSLGHLTAHYECSDTLINRLWDNIVWSARSNFVSIPTDCPQRNERMGWSGDISVFAHTATYLADVEAFLRRHLRAMRDTQGDDGRFMDVAPMRGEGFGGLLWGSAGITVAWECYRHWGNIDLLREHYDAMAEYIKYVQKDYIDDSGLLVQHHQWGDLGDWLSPVYQQDDKSLLWECYYIYDLDIMSHAAAILGKDVEALEYSQLRDERKEFFRKTYLSTDGTTIWSAFDIDKQGQPVNTLTSYLLPLAFDICEDTDRQAMINHLVSLIQDNGYHLMVGFIGVPWIGETLSRIGRNDLIYRILVCQEYPSWLYSVCQGATTIWERLNAYVAGEGFPAGNSMNSFNHYSFGSIGSWLIERSLGIKMEGANLTLQPTPDPTQHLTWARGHYNSRIGRIDMAWELLDNEKVKYSFVIPEGLSATVILPNQKPAIFTPGSYEIIAGNYKNF